MNVQYVGEYFPETPLKLRRMITETECWAIVQCPNGPTPASVKSYEKCLYYQMKLIRKTRHSNPLGLPYLYTRAAAFARGARLNKLAIHLDCELSAQSRSPVADAS